MVKLVVQDDAGKSAVVPIEGEITIGRDADNTICLTDRNVSRHHAAIVGSDDYVEVRDLGSYNGVLVNGERITTSTRVSDRDRIQIGNYLLAVNGNGIRPVRNVLGPSTSEPEWEEADPGEYEEAYDSAEIPPRKQLPRPARYAVAEQSMDWPSEASGSFSVRAASVPRLPDRAIRLAPPIAERAETTSGVYEPDDRGADSIEIDVDDIDVVASAEIEPPPAKRSGRRRIVRPVVVVAIALLAAAGVAGALLLSAM
jgi:hypothetical protein